MGLRETIGGLASERIYYFTDDASSHSLPAVMRPAPMFARSDA